MRSGVRSYSCVYRYLRLFTQLHQQLWHQPSLDLGLRHDVVESAPYSMAKAIVFQVLELSVNVFMNTLQATSKHQSTQGCLLAKQLKKILTLMIK